MLRGIRGAAGAVDLVEKLKGDAAMLLCRLPRPKAAPAERAAVGTAKAGEARRGWRLRREGRTGWRTGRWRKEATAECGGGKY